MARAGGRRPLRYALMAVIELNLLTLFAALVIGLAAGTLGGLAGIGGSMVILPALHLVFGEPPDRPQVHHMYIAAALIVNVAVAVPSLLTHLKARAVRTKLLTTLLPVTSLTMICAVLVSNLIDGERLRIGLGVFLIAYCLWSLWVLAGAGRRAADEVAHYDAERASAGRLSVCGFTAGGIGGLLGLAGGVVMVPMLQLLCKVKLRNAVATSSAVICVTAVLAAVVKLSTLGRVGGGAGESVGDALMLAAAMVPSAIVGARLGAWLTHKLPIAIVRAVITTLLIIVAVRLMLPREHVGGDGGGGGDGYVESVDGVGAGTGSRLMMMPGEDGIAC